MLLYQAKGEDGFFLIRPIPKVFLVLSAIIRDLKIDRLFPFFPRVKKDPNTSGGLILNLAIARILTKQLLHLFGYRAKETIENKLHLKSREHATQTALYQKEKWY